MVFSDDEIERSRTQEQRGAGAAKREAAERQREQAKLAKSLEVAMKAKNERGFSAALRQAGIADGSEQWKSAWNAYRDYWR